MDNSVEMAKVEGAEGGGGRVGGWTVMEGEPTWGNLVNQRHPINSIKMKSL